MRCWESRKLKMVYRIKLKCRTMWKYVITEEYNCLISLHLTLNTHKKRDWIIEKSTSIAWEPEDLAWINCGPSLFGCVLSSEWVRVAYFGVTQSGEILAKSENRKMELLREGSVEELASLGVWRGPVRVSDPYWTTARPAWRVGKQPILAASFQVAS